jgi:SAM-dependent methyltransferase
MSDQAQMTAAKALPRERSSGAGRKLRYDLALFRSLNEEYRDKPLMSAPRDVKDPAAMSRQAAARAGRLIKAHGIAGARCLEIGCGRGETARALAGEHGCEVTGLDVVTYPEWSTAADPKAQLLRLDVTAEPFAQLGSFDFIYSFAVWEHIRHPFAALRAAHALLRPGGRMYLNANLYRGPSASHRYREVFFPWPHLLFTDEVFEAFYLELWGRPAYPAWVNKLVAAEYEVYFRQLGFAVESITFTMKPFDEAFYGRFEEKLGRYPRFDLERDFIVAVVRRPE